MMIDLYGHLELASGLAREGVIAGWSIEANLGAKHWINYVNVNYALQIGDDPPIF